MGLIVENVRKNFGPKTAVQDISFDIEKPGVFGLLGTNGAGKTTTIRMILGILQKDSGVIQWEGKPVKRGTTKFGYLPEERGIYPKAKVKEQLMYFATLRGIPKDTALSRVKYWLDRLGATEYENSPAEHLSKGNQQKIQLISCLVHDPELIILDEPFSGLDPVNTDLFKGVVNELVQNGKLIIMSSHQMSVVEEYCQEILILKKGATVLSGNLRAIKASYGRTNLSINCESDITSLAENEGIRLEKKTAYGYEFKIQSDEDAYKLLDRIRDLRIRIDKFEIREPSLHEIFVEKVGE